MSKTTYISDETLDELLADITLVGPIYEALAELKERREKDKKKSIKPSYSLESLPDEDPLTTPYAYVDGSFNANTNTYGYGGFIYENGKRHILQGSGDDTELAGMRNVAGEIMGCINAVKMAQTLDVRSLRIYYDYKGIEQWAIGGWKAKKPGTKDYADFMHKVMQNMDIEFVHVKGHTGVIGNEIADKLAKQAVGIN